jgi:mRNA interferase MazF
LLKPGDVVVVDFPGVTGIKRRPAIALSSDAYHSTRPDVILGLITSQVAGSIGPTDYALVDWSAAGLRLPSLFRSFLVTVPRTAVYQVVGHLSDQDWLSERNSGPRWLFDQLAS